MFQLTLFNLLGVSLGIDVLIQNFLGFRTVAGQTVSRVYNEGPTIIIAKAQAEALAALVGGTVTLDMYDREGNVIGDICFNPMSVTQYKDVQGSSPALSYVYSGAGLTIVLKSDLETELTGAGLLPATTP